MSELSKWLLAAQNAPQMYKYATVAAIAYPPTRKLGFKMASYGIRTTASGIAAMGRSPFVKGGSFGMTSLLGSVVAGISIGIGSTATITYALEDKGYLKSGATQDYLNVHLSKKGLKRVYNVPDNVSKIFKHHF